MTTEVVIIGERLDDIIAAAVCLHRRAATVSALQASNVARRAQRAQVVMSRRPGGLVLFLTERDNSVDIRAVLASNEGSVLLVAPTSPPRASLSRLAAEFGAGLCSRDDPSVVREALLIALAAQVPERAVS